MMSMESQDLPAKSERLLPIRLTFYYTDHRGQALPMTFRQEISKMNTSTVNNVLQYWSYKINESDA